MYVGSLYAFFKGVTVLGAWHSLPPVCIRGQGMCLGTPPLVVYRGLPLAGTPQRLCGLHAVGPGLCAYYVCMRAAQMPGLCAYYVCMRAAQMPSLAALYVRPGQVWAVGDLGRSPPLYVRPGQVWAVGDLGRSPQCEPCGGSGPCTTTNHSFHLNVEARCHLVMLAIRQLVKLC